MAYKNFTPVISRIDKGVRDTDFIPINELKLFDAKLDEIIKKFESTQNEDSADALSIAKKLKDIEYNLYDALEFDSEGNIVGYNHKQDPVTGKDVPIPGDNSIYAMLQELEEKYGEFVKLMGSDPNIDNWKIDLDAYYTDAINVFKNKLSGVFSNSAEAVTLEAKNDKSTDYVLNESVNLKKNQIMRLNPDLQSYIRTVNVLPSEQNKNYIAFEVIELESNSLVLNLKIQNGFLYSDVNIVLDNGKWFVTKEKILGKELDGKFEINIFKYTKNGKTSYVFCLNTDYPELDQYYNFEIEGLLINGYSFNATGLTVDKHNDYYVYNLVDKNVVTKPVYNETYYIKTSQSYEAMNEITGEKEVLTREVYEPVTKLLSFDEDTDYYVRNTIFAFVKSFDFIHGEDDGFIKNNVFSDQHNQVVVEDLSYSGEINALKVNYEVSEAFDDDEEVDTNDYINNRNKIAVDDSVRMFVNGDSYVSVGKSPRKINNKIAASYGEEAFDIVDLRPGEIVNTNAHLNRDLSNVIYEKINGTINKATSSSSIVTENVLLDENFDENKLYDLNGNLAYIKDDGTVYFQKKTAGRSSESGWIKDTTIKNFVENFNSNENIVNNKLVNWNIDYQKEFIIVTVSQANDNHYIQRGREVQNDNGITVYEDNDPWMDINFGKRYQTFIIHKDGSINILDLSFDELNQSKKNNNIKYSIYDSKIFFIGSSSASITSYTNDSIDKRFFKVNRNDTLETRNQRVEAINKTSVLSIKILYALSGGHILGFFIYDINTKSFVHKQQMKIFDPSTSFEPTSTSGFNGAIIIQFANYIYDRAPYINHLIPEVMDENDNEYINFIGNISYNDVTNLGIKAKLYKANYTNLSTSNSTIEPEIIANNIVINENLNNSIQKFYENKNLKISSVRAVTQQIRQVVLQGKQNPYIIDYLNAPSDWKDKYNNTNSAKLYLFNNILNNLVNDYQVKIFEEAEDAYIIFGKKHDTKYLIEISYDDYTNSIEFGYIIVPDTVNDLIDVKNINGEIYFKFDTGLYKYEDKPYFRRVNNDYRDDPEYEYYVKDPDTEEYRRITDDDLDIVDGTKQFKSDVNYYYIDNTTFTLEEIVARDGAKMSDVIEVDKYDKTSTRLPDNRLVDYYEKNNNESYAIFKSIETNESPSKPYIYQDYYTEVDTTQPIDDSITYYEGFSKIEKPAGTLTEWKKVYKQISTGGETPDPNIEYFTRNDTNEYISTGSPGTLSAFDQSIAYYVNVNEEYYTREENILCVINQYFDNKGNFKFILPVEARGTEKTYGEKYLFGVSYLIVTEHSFQFFRNTIKNNLYQPYSIYENENTINDVFAKVIYLDKSNTTNDYTDFTGMGKIIFCSNLSLNNGVGFKLWKYDVYTRFSDEIFTVYDNIGTNRIFFRDENHTYKVKEINGIDYFIKDTKDIYSDKTDNVYNFHPILENENIIDIIESANKVFFVSESGILKQYVYVQTIANDPNNLTPERNANIYNDSKLYLTSNEYFRADIIDDETILDDMLKSDDPIIKKKLKIINKYIRDNLVFINSFQIGIFKRSANTVDIIVIPDDSKINNGEFYTLFTLNLSTDYYSKSSTEKVLVFHGLTKLEEEFINKKILWQERWTSIASNNIITLAMGNAGLFFSYNNDTFHKLNDPITENTHEPIVFDDSYEVMYDGYKKFFITKKDKTSTDHTAYVSENGTIWKKFNIDHLINGLKNQAFYPRIYVSNLNKTWIIGGANFDTVMLDAVALENLVNKYTEVYMTNKFSLYADSSHIYELPFHCIDLFYTDEFFYALDVTNNRFVYATQGASTSINDYITTWNNITIENQTFTSPRINDFKIFGYDLRGAILYGSGLYDSTTKGLWVAPYDNPGTFTKSDLPEGIGVSEFYPCVSIYKEPNGPESSRDFIFVKGTDDQIYKTDDFGYTWMRWSNTQSTHDILHVGSYNNWYMFINEENGLRAGFTKDGIPENYSNYRHPLLNPKACISRNLIDTVGYNVFHITDDSSGKILYSTDLENWYAASVISYNPITELNDSGDRIIGSTVLYPIAVNNDFDESYCPTGNLNINKAKLLNGQSVYTSLDSNNKVLLHIDNNVYEIPNTIGINPTNFLIITTANTKIRYALCSETARGLWISEECDIGTFHGELTHIPMDIYVEKGFQTSKGFFVYGRDINNKTKIYFTSSSEINNGEINFVEKLSVDYLDYIKAHRDDILISTYNVDNPYDKYSFNNDTLLFEKETAIDITDVFSFNNTFEYEGELYFINGSGSNNTVRSDNSNNEGIFRIRKTLSSSGSISYEITPFALNENLYKDISPANGQIYTGILQTSESKMLLITSGKNANDTEFIVNKFIVNFKGNLDSDKIKEINDESLNRYDDPVLYDINSITLTEHDHATTVCDMDRSGSTGNIPTYGFVVQNNSFRSDINNLEDNNLTLDNKVDEFYFDKENKTLTLNNYGINDTNDFKLNSEKVAYNASINTNKQAVVIALGQDNALSVFDKDLDCLKVLTTGYYDKTTGQDIFVKLDPEYNNLQSVIIGVNNSEVKVFGLYYGKFPKFETDVDTRKRYLDYSKSVTIYKVYSVDYDILKASTDKVVLAEENTFTYDAANNNVRTELKDFIRANNYVPSKDLDLSDNDLQVIIASNNILYKNTYSLVVWNSKKKCIQVYSKYKADDSLMNQNDTTNVNEKKSSILEGVDFERNVLYTNIENPYGKGDTLTFLKYGETDVVSNSIDTRKFVANLTNRKNLFLTNENDYERDILFDSSRYLKYMQTRFGVFRFITEDYVKAVNQRLGTNFEYNENNFNRMSGVPTTYRNVENTIYFTTEGSNSIMQIVIGNKGTVVNVWETINFLFIQTKEYIQYVYEEQEVYKLYRLDNIPDSNRTEIISIHDRHYFTEIC